MALPASGNSISLSQVNTELGLSSTATISLNDAAVRSLFGIASGQISMSDGFGKSNIQTFAADVVVFGGGGGGAGANGYSGGGGGGGGSGAINTSALYLQTKTDYVFTIGAGGAGSAADSSSTGSTGGSTVVPWGWTVVGGTGGNSRTDFQYIGGSGGNSPGYAGSGDKYGFSGNVGAFSGGDGAPNGGGGAARGTGAGTVGNSTNGGTGSPGYDLSTGGNQSGWPSNTRIAGGGGGGGHNAGFTTSSGGTGGALAGNGGGYATGNNGGDATFGYGGGGGGGGIDMLVNQVSGSGGSGGSGSVVIQWPKSYGNATYTGTWSLSSTNTDSTKWTYILRGSGTLRIG